MQQWEYKIIELSTELSNLGNSSIGSDSLKDAGLIEVVRFRKIEAKEEDGLLGKRIKKVSVHLTTNAIESMFNELGKQGWDLCSTVPLVTNTVHAFRHGTRTTSVQFIFKRQSN